MSTNIASKFKVLLILAAAVVVGCRKDDSGPSTPNLIDEGLLILNEGGWNAGNASLDYYDFKTKFSSKDIFGAANSGAKLGDVGQEVGVYGAKIYVVVNGSNLIEVIDLNTLKSKEKITAIQQPRDIVFHEDKAFVTSFDDNVYVIDTTTFAIKKQIPVGRDPEQMVIVGNKLYVANSGGLDATYDRTISVIDLTTLAEIKKIDVDVNLGPIAADQYGDIYVISQGRDWGTYIPSALYVIDTQTETVKKKFDFEASSIAIAGDNAYLYSYSYTTQKISYIKLNVKDETVITDTFIDGSAITRPYSIAVDPVTNDVYIADAKDFNNPGEVLCFDAATGEKKFSFQAGIGPAHFAFYYKK